MTVSMVELALPPPGLLSGLFKVDDILGHLSCNAHHYCCHDNGIQERDDLVGLKRKKKIEAMGK